MSNDTYEIPAERTLAEAYIGCEDPRIGELYGYYAGAEDDWSRRLAALRERDGARANQRELADALESYNKERGAGSRTLAAIAAIRDGAPVVVGGQQAGLWTGPLLVIHKAVSIIGAAKSASSQLGVAVVPVFWVAGEDHDWDEAGHAYVISAEQELRKLLAARPAGARTAVSRIGVSGELWEQWLSELEQTLPHSEFKEGLLQRLGEMAGQSGTLSDMFSRIMIWLFESEGLVLIDADDARIRRLEAPMFRLLLERNDELEAAYAAAAERVRSQGYSVQADTVSGAANLFLFHPDAGDERLLLYKRDGKFGDRKGTAAWSKEELLQMAEQRPEQFSNNVLTRPLMQDYLFPVLATVLGPGEMAYWAQTGDAFRTIGMEMPIVVPRMSFTLIEGTVAKYMAKYELDFADVQERFEQRKEQWLKEQDSLDIETKFADVKEAFGSMYKPLLELAASVQPGLAKLGDTNMTKIVEQIGYMEAKTVDAYNKQFEASLRQLDRIALALKPGGRMQERVVTMAVYWNRYGDGWLDKLLAMPYSRTGGHQLVYL